MKKIMEDITSEDDWDPTLKVDHFWQADETIVDFNSLVTGFHFGEVFHVKFIINGLKTFSNLIGVSVSFLIEEDNQVVLIIVQIGQKFLIDLFNLSIDLEVFNVIQPVADVIL